MSSRVLLVALAVTMICVATGAVSAQNVSSNSSVSSTSPDLSGCQPVGDSSISADVHVCGATLDDDTVVFDLYAETSSSVYVALVDGSADEGSVGTVQRRLSQGSTTLREPAPSTRSVRYSIGNLDGFAFGDVGRTVDLGPDPTWREFFAGLSGAVLGVVMNVVFAVFIVLRGRETFINELW